MLGDLFGAEDDTQDQAFEAQKSTFYRTKPPHCAGDLDLPPMPRQPSNFVGLLNQGATCYLNSLFQVLFLTPQFRNAIYQLPLCEGSIDKKTDFVKGRKGKILFEIQRLLVMLQESDMRAWSTEDLTKSFGWESNQGQEQQDIHELNRVMFDAIETSLNGTMYDGLIQELYFGTQTTLITCLQCGNSRSRPEPFLDLPLKVSGMKGVEESLERLFEIETLDEDNKLECEICQEKTLTSKGLRIQKLPPVLTFCLNRIELDYATWERKKINDKFEYPMELDMSKYIDESEGSVAAQQAQDKDLTNYELKGIVIHRGGPYGGHYHAFIKDDMKEGNWNVDLPEKFHAAPSQVKSKADLEKELKEKEAEGKAKEEEVKAEPEVVEQPVEVDDSADCQNCKKKKKCKKHRGQQNQNQGKKQKGGKNNQQEKKKEEEKKKKDVAWDYDLCDFPIAYSSEELVQNWFDFNDGTVRPIFPGTLQQMFGGSSASAYMLIYRQRKLNEQAVKQPKKPDYWNTAMQSLKELQAQERVHYEQMKNQLDLVVQEYSSHFVRDEEHPDFVKYTVDEDLDNQGLKVRLCFDDTVAQVKEKVAKECGLADDSKFELIEVQRLQNSYCQFLNPLSEVDPTKQIKDTAVSHLSTWVLLVDQPDEAANLTSVSGENSLPMTVKYRFGEKEGHLDVYAQMRVVDFVEKLNEQVSGPGAKNLKIKIVEETVTRRIDTQIYEKETLTLPVELRTHNMLFDIKMVHMSSLLVEEKDENEVEEEAQTIKQGGAQASGASADIEYLDDTENMRTVIVNTENEKDDFKRFQVNLDWSLQELNAFLLEQFKLQGVYRLRRLIDNQLFVKEELESKLKAYEGFKEGGTRIQLEVGRAPTLREITVNVVLYGKEDDLKQFYFNADVSLQEAKEEVSLKLLGTEQTNLTADKYTLYRVDAFEEPTFPLRRLKAPLEKCNVSNGELLILKSDKELLPDEQLKLSVHLTQTGLSQDSTFLQDVEVFREFTLNDFKEILMDLPALASQTKHFSSVDHLRIREKSHSGFFGKIHREGTKSLKQLNIKDHTSIVVQLLPEPEVLPPNTFVLLYSARNVATKEYEQTREIRFTGTRISDIKVQAAEVFDVPEGDIESIEVAKHVPHAFEWKWINEEEMFTEKKKKNKTVQVRAGDSDIKKFPVLLKDGDHIGVKWGFATETLDDDWQTAHDAVAREEFRVLKEAERKAQLEEARKTGKNRGNDGAAVKIRLDDDDDEEVPVDTTADEKPEGEVKEEKAQE